MASGYYSPGVYIEEVNSGPRPIEAVATAVAAFVGISPYSSHADANKPVLITSWSQYVEKFGKIEDGGRRNPHMPDAYMSHAVFGYFLNGGNRCYVTRVVPGEGWKKLKPETREIPASKDKQTTVLRLAAAADAVDQNVEVTIERAPGQDPATGTFQVRIRKGGKDETDQPIKVTLSNTPTTAPKPSKPVATAAGEEAAATTPAPSNPAPRRAVNLLEGKSKLVALYEEPTSMVFAERVPIFGTYVLEVAQPTELGVVSQDVLIGDVRERSGVAGLEIAEEVTMVCCPDLMSPLAYANGEVVHEQIQAVQRAMIDYCESVGGRMALLDAPPDMDPQTIEKWVTTEANYDSMHAALYYPWLTIANPLTGHGQPATINVPPCGHMAGVYARNDSEIGVHKAPANEVVRGALRPVAEITRGEQDGLNPNRINCIRSFPGRGVRVWGARTLSSDPAWRYINVRRLFNMVERSIERNTQWVVFQPNDPSLWSRIRRDVNAFLTVLWRDGMLFGNTPQEAFFVKCDEEINPQEVRDMGRLIIEVGLAPVKPAEFVIFRFSQYSGGGQ